MQANRATRVSVVLIPETTASTLLSVYDIFRLFSSLVPGEAPYSVTIVGDSKLPVTTSSTIMLQAQAGFDEVPETDIVILPSLLLPSQGWPAGKYPRMVAWLQRQYAQGALLCSACSGVFPLMETGLLGQLPVTCHWFYEQELRKSYPDANIRIEKTLVITGEDQRLVMSGAAGSWHDLVLYLINRFSGPAAASAVAKFFLLSWHPEGQMPYASFRENTAHNDAAISKAQAWIRQHWMQSNPIEMMVRSSGLAERSFKRRFKNATGLSPLDYIQHTRIEHAKQLLENSSLPVESIAAETGYEDAAFFRKVFKRITTMTPSAYRLKFRHPYLNQYQGGRLDGPPSDPIRN